MTFTNLRQFFVFCQILSSSKGRGLLLVSPRVMSGEFHSSSLPLSTSIVSLARFNKSKRANQCLTVVLTPPPAVAMASNQQDVSQRSLDHVTTSRLFQMKEHCTSSFTVMNQLRKENQLLDVRFRINEHCFTAHRVVLASCSPYLRAMFTCGMRESTQEEIVLRDIEPQAMELLIEFAYTGEIEVTTENVQDLLPAAGILQLRDLKVACCEFLSDHMDVTNCLGIKQFADMHSCPDLVKKANRFIIRKFADVVRTDEFLDVPHHVLCELLGNDHLHVENELQVFNAFLRWIDHDLDGRAPFAYDLLDCIRIPLLAKDHWEHIFNTHRLFKVSISRNEKVNNKNIF